MPTFQRDPHMERLLKMKRKDRDRFDKLRPQDKISVGYYERQLAAAEPDDAEADK